MPRCWWKNCSCAIACSIVLATPTLSSAADRLFAGCGAGLRPIPTEECFLVETFLGGRMLRLREPQGYLPERRDPSERLVGNAGAVPDGAPIVDEVQAESDETADLDLEQEPLTEPALDPHSVAAPDIATIRQIIENNPAALGSLSIGSPDGGALYGGVRLPESSLWHERNLHDAWGTTETLFYLRTAIEAVAREYPGSPSLCIGDLSRRQGGPIDRHRSHESGRDVDVGWYFVEGEARDFRVASVRHLDLPRCWALVRALITQTDVEHIFMDRSVQQVLFAQALEMGEDRLWLERVFAFPGGRRNTIVQHVRGHRNHLHVRFFNPRAQAWGRVAYPLLAEVGLVPPPVVYYRARRGDTLSTIASRYGSRVAAIRAANGLSSNLIRAGRRYRVPVRHLASVATAAPPTVPPRILPPSSDTGSGSATPWPLRQPTILLVP